MSLMARTHQREAALPSVPIVGGPLSGAAIDRTPRTP